MSHLLYLRFSVSHLLRVGVKVELNDRHVNQKDAKSALEGEFTVIEKQRAKAFQSSLFKYE